MEPSFLDTDRTQTGSLSWVAQLQHYVARASSGSADAVERKRLCDAVLENPTSAEEWWQFLMHEDAALQQAQVGMGPCVHITQVSRGEGSHHLTLHTCACDVLKCRMQGLPSTSSNSAAAAPSPALRQLYHRATELVQRCRGRPSPAYVHVWLGYARHQWRVSEDDARDTIKTLKV